MAGVFELARGIHCCANILFLLPDQRPYVVKNVCVCVLFIYIYIYIYICTYLTAYRLYMNYRCYQIIMQLNILTQIGSEAKCLLDLLNRTNLVHTFSKYVYCFSLHVSGNCVLIIRIKYRTYATPGINHSEKVDSLKLQGLMS